MMDADRINDPLRIIEKKPSSSSFSPSFTSSSQSHSSTTISNENTEIADESNSESNTHKSYQDFFSAKTADKLMEKTKEVSQTVSTTAQDVYKQTRESLVLNNMK